MAVRSSIVRSVSQNDQDEDLELATLRHTLKAQSGEMLPIPQGLEISLSVSSGPAAGGVFRVEKNPTIIGRGRLADVRIDDPSLSRLHAIVSFVDYEFRITDNASGNGTFLNGSLVKEYRLRHGDKVLVGESLLLFSVTRA